MEKQYTVNNDSADTVEVSEDEQLDINKKHTYIFTVSLSSKDILLMIASLFKVVSFIVLFLVIKHSSKE